MLTYQRNALLALLAQFEAKLYQQQQDDRLADDGKDGKIFETLIRNIQSIRKQLKKL